MLKKLGAKLIHIQRNLPSWFESYKSGIDCKEASELHKSEISWIREDFDFTIINDLDSVDKFNSNIKNFIKNIF